MTNIFRNLLAGVAAVGLVGTGAALRTGTLTLATPAAHAAPVGIPTDGSIADAAERAVDSVVGISVKMTGDRMVDIFGDAAQGPQVEAQGSGVIVTADGRILTNSHVVDKATEIKVLLSDGGEYYAKVIGKDPKADLAVIQLQGRFPTLKPIAFGDSASLRLGDVVLTIGNGLGLGNSVSVGIVSAKSRGMGGHIEEYEDFIQTDAVINHGNSGGALVNLKGELVGINTAIASRTGEYSGIGFAIPMTMVRPIMDMLVKDGHVTRGYLGVTIGTATPSMMDEHKLGAPHGAAIGEVQQGSPAQRAGLVEGDVVVAINGTEVRTGEALRNTIALIKPGTNVTLDLVHRDGRAARTQATLGELADQPVAADNGGNSDDDEQPIQIRRRGR
jgi:S1-C subfamily serine protease